MPQYASMPQYLVQAPPQPHKGGLSGGAIAGIIIGIIALVIIIVVVCIIGGKKKAKKAKSAAIAKAEESGLSLEGTPLAGSFSESS